MGEARQEVAISLNGLARRPCVDANVSRTPRSIQPLAVALCWLLLIDQSCTLHQVLCLSPANNFVVDHWIPPCHSLTVQYGRASGIPATYESRLGRLFTTHRNHTSLSALSYRSPAVSVVGEADACLKVPPNHVDAALPMPSVRFSFVSASTGDTP